MLMDAGLDRVHTVIPHHIDRRSRAVSWSSISRMRKALSKPWPLLEPTAQGAPAGHARASYAPKLTLRRRDPWGEPPSGGPGDPRPRPQARRWTSWTGAEVKLFGARVVEDRGAPPPPSPRRGADD